ncbi:MAG: hypothetical protein OEZ47_05005 [Gammaproteobacteria bacterium]|nr:hypothetical protein [Gammaproteobacteria bacterium]
MSDEDEDSRWSRHDSEQPDKTPASEKPISVIVNIFKFFFIAIALLVVAVLVVCSALDVGPF